MKNPYKKKRTVREEYKVEYGYEDDSQDDEPD